MSPNLLLVAVCTLVYAEVRGAESSYSYRKEMRMTLLLFIIQEGATAEKYARDESC